MKGIRGHTHWLEGRHTTLAGRHVIHDETALGLGGEFITKKESVICMFMSVRLRFLNKG